MRKLLSQKGIFRKRGKVPPVTVVFLYFFCRSVQEVAVVGNHDQGTWEVIKVIFKNG